MPPEQASGFRGRSAPGADELGGPVSCGVTGPDCGAPGPWFAGGAAPHRALGRVGVVGGVAAASGWHGRDGSDRQRTGGPALRFCGGGPALGSFDSESCSLSLPPSLLTHDPVTSGCRVRPTRPCTHVLRCCSSRPGVRGDSGADGDGPLTRSRDFPGALSDSPLDVVSHRRSRLGKGHFMPVTSFFRNRPPRLPPWCLRAIPCFHPQSLQQAA